jgi:hydroxymethylpyrimidine pyrophosphatase-like HAD family hydrolase
MRYRVLACDYDGTLAHDGHVDAPVVAALDRLLATGRELILVTGRQLPELLAIFPQIDRFVRVVAENGAILYRPGDCEQKLLAPAPPADFVEALKRRGINADVGHAVVATWRPHDMAVREVIHELKLEWNVILNKDAVMALPAGVNKASGLRAALNELGRSLEETVGIGDAENDFCLLRVCAVGVAVANALTSVKKRADLVTAGDHGAGVAELVDRIIKDDLAELALHPRKAEQS